MKPWPCHANGRKKLPHEMSSEERRVAMTLVFERLKRETHPLMLAKLDHIINGGRIH